MSNTPKEIIFEEEARQKLFSGIKQLADVVAFTLGPKGRNVGLEKSWGAPTITNDFVGARTLVCLLSWTFLIAPQVGQFELRSKK